jgi:hypothetical protein
MTPDKNYLPNPDNITKSDENHRKPHRVRRLKKESSISDAGGNDSKQDDSIKPAKTVLSDNEFGALFADGPNPSQDNQKSKENSNENVNANAAPGALARKRKEKVVASSKNQPAEVPTDINPFEAKDWSNDLDCR